MKKKIFSDLKTMTIVGRCSVGVSILFWQLVSLGVFAYALAFLFWPTDANKLFATALPENVVRFMGSQFLLADAGINQMVESSSGYTRPLVKRAAFASTIVLYILAGVTGLVVVSLETPIFIEAQTLAFQILYSLFLGALLLGFCGVCGGFCRVQTGVQLSGLESVEIGATTGAKPLRSKVTRDDIRNGRR